MKMKLTLLVLIGVVVAGVTANIAKRLNVCEEETEDGSFINVCCEGWTGLDEGCVTPVCKTECELHGGTCVSSNVCANCPEDRFGDNCERSLCQQEREDHRLLSWQERRMRFKPSCLPDGSYTLLQCSTNTGMCHCVNRWTGDAYVNTYTRGVPDCSKYFVNEKPMFSRKEVIPMRQSNEELTIGGKSVTLVVEEPAAPCHKKHEDWESSSFKFFTTEPDCTDDGYFVSQYCDYFFGYCICIDRDTGLYIESTKVYRSTIDCSNVTIPEPVPEEEPEPMPMPDEGGCTMDGVYYRPDQSFYRDCNLCACHGYNIIECTTRTCNQDACHLGETDKVIEQMVDGQCHHCLCNHGVFECSTIDCDQTTDPVEVEDVTTCGNKPPKTSYFDECNSCYCSSSGNARCTLLGCFVNPNDCYVADRYYQNGQQLTRGCDTMRCVDGQLEVVESCADTMVDMVLTQAKPEVACEFEGESFYNGESMLIGVKLCKCQFFEWHCQPMTM